MSTLAITNSVLAFLGLIVFVGLAKKSRNRMRLIYLATCFYMLYILAIYGHYFVTGYSVGIEYTRPATGVAIALLLSLGSYEFFRD